MAHDHQRNCYTCGKMIWPPDLYDYAFKRKEGKNARYFCGWSCMRSYDRRCEAEKKKKVKA